MPRLKDMLEKARPSLEMVLPKHLTPDRLLKVVLVAISRTPLLQQCTADSIVKSVMTSGQLGLDCSGVLGSAYLVPYWSSKQSAYEAQLVIGYRGLIDLARRSGEIETIEARLVYAEDRFEIEYGTSERIVHVPNFDVDQIDDPREKNGNTIRGAYMVARLKGCTLPQVEYMSRGQLDRVRDGSKAAFDKQGNLTGIWLNHFAEMCRKTVIRRGVKYLPVSVEFADAIDHENQAEIRAARITETGAADLNAMIGASASRSDALSERLKGEREQQQIEQAQQNGTGEIDSGADSGTQDAYSDAPASETARNAPDAPESQPQEDKAPQPKALDARQGMQTAKADPAPSSLNPVEEWEKWMENRQMEHDEAGGDRKKLASVINGALLKAGKVGKGYLTDAMWRQAMAEALLNRRGVFAYLAKEKAAV